MIPTPKTVAAARAADEECSVLLRKIVALLRRRGHKIAPVPRSGSVFRVATIDDVIVDLEVRRTGVSRLWSTSPRKLCVAVGFGRPRRFPAGKAGVNLDKVLAEVERRIAEEKAHAATVKARAEADEEGQRRVAKVLRTVQSLPVHVTVDWTAMGLTVEFAAVSDYEAIALIEACKHHRRT